MHKQQLTHRLAHLVFRCDAGEHMHIFRFSLITFPGNMLHFLNIDYVG